MTALPAEVPRWNTAPLNAEHHTGFLKSGRAEIDNWLHEHAQRLQEDASCRTYVWADQPPYVAAFYTLVPHRIESEDDTRISGHTGGDISGYLIAKIGINVDAASGSSRLPGDPGHTLSNILLLLIDAVVHASRASYLAGGRYVFIDINNEPSTLSDAVQQIGFSSISSAGSSMHVMKVPRPRNIPS